MLDALKIERAAIVGFSLGGGPALALAASKPERVSRLVLADVGAGADDPVKIEGMARRWGALIGHGDIDELVCDMLRSELFKVYARRSPAPPQAHGGADPRDADRRLALHAVRGFGQAEIIVPADAACSNPFGRRRWSWPASSITCAARRRV